MLTIGYAEYIQTFEQKLFCEWNSIISVENLGEVEYNTHIDSPHIKYW